MYRLIAHHKLFPSFLFPLTGREDEQKMFIQYNVPLWDVVGLKSGGCRERQVKRGSTVHRHPMSVTRYDNIENKTKVL